MNSADPDKQWEAYQKAIDHECKLLFDRINALLNSQAVLVAAVAFLSQQHQSKARVIATAVACIGLAIALISLFTIMLGCRVLRLWHLQGRQLIERWGQSDLRGCYLQSRGRTPDLTHWVTIDLYGGIVPMIFVCFWILAICWVRGVI